MNWAEWAPTIVSGITGVFVSGVFVGNSRAMARTQRKHERRLDGHDTEFTDVRERVSTIEGHLRLAPR